MDGRNSLRISRKCAGTGGRCSFQVKNMVIQTFPHDYWLTQRVKGYCHGSSWSCASCESDPALDAKYSVVVVSACSCVFEAGSDRADRSSDACNVGDTRKSLSEQHVDSILRSRHLVQILSHRNIENHNCQLWNVCMLVSEWLG